MTSIEYLIGFIIAAVLTALIIGGGMTSVYFIDKRRVDPPRNAPDRPREARPHSARTKR